jgi:hypothetical protein
MLVEALVPVVRHWVALWSMLLPATSTAMPTQAPGPAQALGLLLRTVLWVLLLAMVEPTARLEPVAAAQQASAAATGEFWRHTSCFICWQTTHLSAGIATFIVCCATRIQCVIACPEVHFSISCSPGFIILSASMTCFAWLAC